MQPTPCMYSRNRRNEWGLILPNIRNSCAKWSVGDLQIPDQIQPSLQLFLPEPCNISRSRKFSWELEPFFLARAQELIFNFSISSRTTRLGENKFSTLSRKKKICIYISNCNLQIKIYISTGSNVSIIHARFAPIDQARDPLSLFASYYIICHLISNYFHFHTTSAEFCFEYESVG